LLHDFRTGEAQEIGLTSRDADAIRRKVNRRLEPGRKVMLGQFMTPSAIADFMAGMFEPPLGRALLLDAGAGIGSLSIAAVRKLGTIEAVDAWEIDSVMLAHLRTNLEQLGVDYRVIDEDFIASAVLQILLARGRRYTHAILNPPYRKLHTDTPHRRLLRKVGIETVNLYTAFVALAVLLMRDGGQVVAIIPRSFCNGPYYRPFRQMMLRTCSLDRIHVFGSRTKAFKDDEVLQENVIIKLVKGREQGAVVISCSHDQGLTDYRERRFAFSEIVCPTDSELFIRVPTESRVREDDDLFVSPLSELGLEVCTGPVVDFRLREFWLDDLVPGAVPLIYPHHFAGGALQYPKRHKKPNALVRGAEVENWLMPNECYVLVKRFSSKEEKRRIVAYVYDPGQIDCKQIGFENHWNVFHQNKRGIDPVLARGLACFLNGTALDRHFRVFSGHTQVNATDLRNIKYPERRVLKILGDTFHSGMTQAEVDNTIARAYAQTE
jgi:adenine-specific DNA-methyltransferase